MLRQRRVFRCSDRMKTHCNILRQQTCKMVLWQKGFGAAAYFGPEGLR